MNRSRFHRGRTGGRLFGLILAVLAAGATGAAQTQTRPRPPQDALQAFPRPTQGQARRVIRLPAESDESALRVGIVVGQTVWVDCNRQVLPVRIEERTAQGWGYTYYVVTVSGPRASTMMACPDNRRRRQFVRGAEEPLVRYNSRLPLVIFAPTDVQVRYRIWRPGPERVAS